MNLNVCIINIAAHVVEILKPAPLMRYDELLARVQLALSDMARFDFILALDFLYATETIDYYAECDSVILVKFDNCNEVTR